MKQYGLDYLRGKLSAKRDRALLRYQYYDMKNQMRKINVLIPPEFLTLTYTMGWCAKAVDSIADRLVFDGFKNDDFFLSEIYSMNNADILFDSAVLSAMISACCFLHISYGDGDYPVIECIDGTSATGIIDTTTNLLTEGYAVLENDAETGYPLREAYFLPDRTEYYVSGDLADTVLHPAGAPLLVPVIYRPDAMRPFGHSRISRACMDIVQTARRTLMRSEVGAEFYSVPQKYIVGLSQKTTFDNRQASLSSFLNITSNGNAEKPTLGQFEQQSMAPHMEHMKMLASMFAGETGLTLDDLGFTTDNPASYDAIRASHEALRLTARKAQRSFGAGFLNAGYLSACLRDDQTYDRSVFRDVKPQWMPIFEPDGAALGAIGDAICKINQAVPDYIGKDGVKAMTGILGDAT
ncbi:MAG TPA: hypothetical protein DDX71_00760 [Ruminococcus sp.]|nr:hypothetical protein [Ruminococcus sp.]